MNKDGENTNEHIVMQMKEKMKKKDEEDIHEDGEGGREEDEGEDKGKEGGGWNRGEDGEEYRWADRWYYGGEDREIWKKYWSKDGEIAKEDKDGHMQ